jgi:hypothetical protein
MSTSPPDAPGRRDGGSPSPSGGAAASPAPGSRTLGRVLGLTAAIVAIVALAFVVGRPYADPAPVAVTYTEGTKGPRPPGLKIFLQRGQELSVLDPATELRRGDALRLVVRGSAPRYLVVRMRDGAGRERVIFPRASARGAALVRPDEALPDALAIDDTPGKATLTALFGTRPFPIDERGARDLEIATVDLIKAP